MVQRQSSKLKVLGSIPSRCACASNQPPYPLCIARCLPLELIPLQHLSVPTDMPKSLPALPYPMRQDSLAERSNAVVTGAIPKGRGLEPHSCHRQSLGRLSVNFCDCCANLPQGFAQTFTSGCASCAFARVCEQRMEPSTSVRANLPGRLRKPSASCCANLPPRVAQTFPSGCAGASFQNSTRAST